MRFGTRVNSLLIALSAYSTMLQAVQLDKRMSLMCAGPQSQGGDSALTNDRSYPSTMSASS